MLYVKDKNNLASHNLWSGGEYTNTTSGLTLSAAQGIVSNEWATNHNASFKITNTSDTSYITLWNSMEYSLENKSLQVSIDQNITTSSFHLQIIQYDSNHQSLKTVQVQI